VIIDGDAAANAWLAGVLEKPGHRVTTTTNAQWAVDEAARGAVDLVLLSTAVPDIDSFSVLRKLKERAATTEIPVLMMTDDSEAPDITPLACGLGASDSVGRPFDAYDVTFRVNRALEFASLQNDWSLRALAAPQAA